MSSPSLFDAFAPLGGKPSNGSSAATSAMNHPNRGIPLSTLAAASVQAAAAAQPGQPYDEKAALDSLTAQLAGTSLKSQGQQNVGASMWPRRSGIVKFFNSTKGFGFIWDNASSEIGDVDIFVHWTTIQGDTSFKSLGEGELVEYELARGPKGFQAINVSGPSGGNVHGDPLARMPLAISSRSRMMPGSRYGPMGIPILQPLVLAGYPPQAAHVDPGYAAYLQQSGRYVPQAAGPYYPIPAGHAPSPAPASYPQVQAAVLPQPAATPVTSAPPNASTQDAVQAPAAAPLPSTAPNGAGQLGAGSAYAQYLAAAQAQRQPTSTNGSSYKSHSPFDVPSVAKQPLSPSAAAGRPIFGSIGGPGSAFANSSSTLSSSNTRQFEASGRDSGANNKSPLDAGDIFASSTWRSETSR
ncbi:hypothetical protein EMMF5_002071 [Cystobasidiomycetes sp. EMM_F5]